LEKRVNDWWSFILFWSNNHIALWLNWRIVLDLR
jgi:hypothetical protein